MQINTVVKCKDFPCEGVNHDAYRVPAIEVDPAAVKLVLISEAAPGDPADYYYASDTPLFAKTTLTAFADAGLEVNSIQDLLDMGIYFTTGIKCSKIGYTIKAPPIRACTKLLEQELALFPNLKVVLLMGDVAIKGLNAIARANKEPRVIPAGSTYKIRGGDFRWRDLPVFPSYLQAGPAFHIEKSKRRMIAEDISKALAIAL